MELFTWAKSLSVEHFSSSVKKRTTCEQGCLHFFEQISFVRQMCECESVDVSSKHQLVNLYLLRIRPGWCTKGHKVYTGSDRMSLRPVRCCSCY